MRLERNEQNILTELTWKNILGSSKLEEQKFKIYRNFRKARSCDE
jgi:hypothetical protein